MSHKSGTTCTEWLSMLTLDSLRLPSCFFFFFFDGGGGEFFVVFLFFVAHVGDVLALPWVTRVSLRAELFPPTLPDPSA